MYLQGPLFLLCALAALMFDGTNSIELDKIHLDYIQSVIAQFMASKGKSSLKYIRSYRPFDNFRMYVHFSSKSIHQLFEL